MTGDMRNEIPEALVERRVLVAEKRSTGVWYQLSLGRLAQVVRRIAGQVGTGPTEAVGEVPYEPQPSDYHVAAVDAMGRGDFAEATRLASDAAELFQTSRERWKRADTLALLGAVANAEGDLPGSRNHYLAAVDEFTALDDLRSVVRLYVVLAQMHFLSLDFSNAVIFSAQALRHSPRDPDALLALGYSLWYRGSPSDAKAQFNRILGADSMAASAVSGRGQIEAELAVDVRSSRSVIAALADLDNALALGLPSLSEEADTRSARAVALASGGRLEEADIELATALALTPDRSLVLLRAALVGERAADITQARKLVVEAERSLPQLSPWHAQLAMNLDARLADRHVDP